MKTAMLVCLVVLVLLIPVAASPTSDDGLIVPGRRIGKWTLAMTVESIVRVLGDPPHFMEGFRDFGLATQPGVLAYDWRGAAGLGLATRDDRTVLVLYTSGTTRYKTAKGIGYGSRLGSVESAYGRPTATFPAWPDGTTVMYEQLGFAVRYWGPIVAYIAVFRPEDARRIWKF